MPTVRTGDVQTYYERRGEGQAVVFVHGAVVDHAMWDQQTDALSDEYETIAYDVRGHGHTGGSARERYSIELFADDLEVLLSALDVEKPVLCGLSMGGMIAQTYAARHPERIAGLVLADTFSPEIRTRGERFLRRVVLPGVVHPIRLVGYERVERANVWLSERVVSDVAGEYGRVQQMRSERPTLATEEVSKVLLAVSRFHETDIDLSRVDAPTLVLYGEHEFGFVKQHAAAFAATLPDVTIEEVPGAGHATAVDNPEYVTTSLRRFLAERVAATAPGPTG